MILNINRYKPKKPLHNWATKQSLAVARGMLTNQNGNLELYARAVDIARVSSLISLMPTSIDSADDCQEDTYYNIGEATWSNLQTQIAQWVNDNGGEAQVIPYIAKRFDKDDLKEVLESNESIDEISCN